MAPVSMWRTLQRAAANFGSPSGRGLSRISHRTRNVAQAVQPAASPFVATCRAKADCRAHPQVSRRLSTQQAGQPAPRAKACSTILVLLLAALPATAAGWIRVRTGGVELLTDAGEKTARTTLDRLEQIRRIFSVAGSGPLPLRIFVFRSEKDFRSYADHPVTGGFYQSGSERDYIVLSAGAGLTRTVTHEYVHLVLDRGPSPLPLWFEEGTAELYSNLDFGRGRMRVGEPVPGHLALLAAEKWLSASELLRANRTSPLYNERTLAGVFYAQSWALAHMLNLAPGWREGMPRFAELLADGAEVRAAFREAFGKTPDQALEELRGYVGGLHSATVEAPPAPHPEAAAVEPVAPLEATLNLADLALEVRQPDLARGLFESAKKSQPDSPAAETGLGTLALAEDRREEARAHLERAIALGSRNGTTYFQLAMLEREAGAPRRRVDQLLEQTVALDPGFGEAQFMLGSEASDDGDFESGVARLGAAARALPRKSFMWHALGYAQARLGHTDQARQAASRALSTAATEQEQRMAEALLESLQ